MITSTAVRHTSTSPRSKGRRRLAGAVTSPARLGCAERDEMYTLLQTYFCGTTRPRFDADLNDKDIVILLRDADDGSLQGFSTLSRTTDWIDGREVVVFFSGDTIVDRDYWGETMLSRIWGQTVFAEVDRIRLERPDATFFWFLICSGYRTWRFLPVFFRRFHPAPDEPTPPQARRILNTFGSNRFGDQFCPETGIVRFRDAAPLRPGVATITDERLRDPRIAFFVRMNPGHAEGDELACLAELSRANLTRAAHRMIGSPL